MSPSTIATDEECSSQSPSPSKSKELGKKASEKDTVSEESLEELSADEDCSDGYYSGDDDEEDMTSGESSSRSGDYEALDFESEEEDGSMDEDVSDEDDPMTVREHPFEHASDDEDDEKISLSNILPPEARRRQY
jgi:hypothetical protein